MLAENMHKNAKLILFKCKSINTLKKNLS